MQSNCELPVIACLLKAWPEALQRRAPNGRNQVRMDPLLYAKLYRRRDSELIQLLSTTIKSKNKNSSSLTLNELCQSSSQYTILKENSFEATKPIPLDNPQKATATETNHSVNPLKSVVLARNVNTVKAEASDNGNYTCDSSHILNDGESRLGAKQIYSPSMIVDKKIVEDRMQQTIHVSMSYEQETADLRSTCMIILKEHQRLVERMKKLEDQEAVEVCKSQIKELKETWSSEFVTSIEMQIHQQLFEQSRVLETIVDRLEQNVSNSHKDTRLELQLMHNRVSQTELMTFYMQQHVEERFHDSQRKPQKVVCKPKSTLFGREADDDARPLLIKDESLETYKKHHQLRSKRRIAKIIRLLLCQT